MYCIYCFRKHMALIKAKSIPSGNKDVYCFSLDHTLKNGKITLLSVRLSLEYIQFNLKEFSKIMAN